MNRSNLGYSVFLATDTTATVFRVECYGGTTAYVKLSDGSVYTPVGAISLLVQPASLPAGTARTASLTIATTSGTVAAGAKKIAFLNTGTAPATVAGGALSAGQSVAFAVDGNDTLAAIAYVASATASLAISAVA